MEQEYKIARVIWIDAIGLEKCKEAKLEEIRKNHQLIVASVGFVYEEDKEKIILLGSFCNKKTDDEFRDVQVIPRCFILSISYLEAKNEN